MLGPAINIDNIICSWLRIHLLCTWWGHPNGGVGVVSARHTLRYQPTTQSALCGTVRYMTSYRRSSACFELIDNFLLTVPTAVSPTPCFTDCRDAQKLLAYGDGQGTELPSFCARTSGSSPLHGRYGHNLNTTPYYGYWVTWSIMSSIIEGNSLPRLQWFHTQS
jgi:hypothetical protein